MFFSNLNRLANPPDHHETATVISKSKTGKRFCDFFHKLSRFKTTTADIKGQNARKECNPNARPNYD